MCIRDSHWGFEVNIAGHAAGGLASYLGEENYGHTKDGKPVSYTHLSNATIRFASKLLRNACPAGAY